MSKYRNSKTVSNGMTFDSKKEAKRYQELLLLARSNEIDNLRTQVRFELIPSQKLEGKTVERPVHYVADFVYYRDGQLVVEDTKGMKTRDYVIKRKLMLFREGIQIHEI